MKLIGYPSIIVDDAEGDIHFDDDIALQGGGEYHAIPAPIAAATDAVVEAARVTCDNCEAKDDETCPKCDGWATLQALDALDKEAK